MERVRGLDAIRAVCAFWVVMGHFGGPPITAGIDATTRAGWLVGGLYNNFWNGPAAVIVFFVISGFCIHYPFSRTLRIPSIAAYVARRYLRIGIPLLVAVAVSPILGVNLDLFHDSILWSLVAELIYYTIYPGLLALRRLGGSWRGLLAASFVAALLLAATNPGAGNYPSWGVSMNWGLGLPCWLLGCVLAESVAQDRRPVGIGIGIGGWRLAVWGASIIASILRFHTPIGYPWSLNGFAILVACWLSQEIQRYRTREPAGWLESAGRWSYSVYLIHVPANAVFDQLAWPNLGYTLNWLAKMIFILGCSYGFYRLVEYPGHLAARWVGRALAPRRDDPPGLRRRPAGPIPPVHETSRLS